jgi:hypothetical protein
VGNLSAHLVLPKISKEVSRKIRIGNFHGVAGSKACATYPRQCKRQSEIIDVVCRAPRTTASGELQNDRQPLAEIPYRCTYPRSDRLSQIRCLQKRLDIRCFHQKDLFHRGSAANRTNLCRKKNPFGVAPHLQRGRPSSLCRTGSSSQGEGCDQGEGAGARSLSASSGGDSRCTMVLTGRKTAI